MGKRKKKGVQDAVEPEAFSTNPFAALGGKDGVGVGSSTGGDFGASLGGDSTPKTAGLASLEKPPARAVLRILRKGRGGKPVTQVTHLGLSADALKEWSRVLRRELGCGAAVEGDTIVVQGDQRERLEKVLQKRGVRRITMG